MKLPNAEQVTISPRKLIDYVLSPTHSVGRFKAKFFADFGFSVSNWELFDLQLRRLVVEEHAEIDEKTSYGQKYLVRGKVKGPTGRTATIVTVWIILEGEEIPRLVSAFPG